MKYFYKNMYINENDDDEIKEKDVSCDLKNVQGL